MKPPQIFFLLLAISVATSAKKAPKRKFSVKSASGFDGGMDFGSPAIRNGLIQKLDLPVPGGEKVDVKQSPKISGDPSAGNDLDEGLDLRASDGALPNSDGHSGVKETGRGLNLVQQFEKSVERQSVSQNIEEPQASADNLVHQIGAQTQMVFPKMGKMGVQTDMQMLGHTPQQSQWNPINQIGTANGVLQDDKQIFKSELTISEDNNTPMTLATMPEPGSMGQLGMGQFGIGQLRGLGMGQLGMGQFGMGQLGGLGMGQLGGLGMGQLGGLGMGQLGGFGMGQLGGFGSMGFGGLGGLGNIAMMNQIAAAMNQGQDTESESSSFSDSISTRNSGGDHAYPVPMPIPFQMPHPQPFPVPVNTPFGVPIPVPQPYPVEKAVEVRVPVNKPYPVPFNQMVPVPVKEIVTVNKPYPVHVPVEVEKPVRVEVPVPFPIPMLQRINVPQRVPYPVQIRKNVPIPMPFPVPMPQPDNGFHKMMC